MMRLFAALELPETVTAAIARLQSGLPGARWVRPENLHLTLRFIGEVEDPMARDLDVLFSRLTAPAFVLDWEEVTWFGDRRKPRQLVIRAGLNPALAHLQAKVERAVTGCGMSADSHRRFVPHVTIARFNAPPGERLLRWHAENSLLDLPPVSVDRFVLFQSFLGAGGPIYQALADYPLAAADSGTAVAP